MKTRMKTFFSKTTVVLIGLLVTLIIIPAFVLGLIVALIV